MSKMRVFLYFKSILNSTFVLGSMISTHSVAAIFLALPGITEIGTVQGRGS